MVDFANSAFYSANVKTLTTDFNVTPYYDDFDSSKNFYRILFKPGFAVQARELTQIQSILQDQIQKFGQHIFKEGSKVLGGSFVIDKNVSYVKVADIDSFGNSVSIENFVGQEVVGQTTGIRAYVALVLDGLQTTQNTKTLYVTYKSANDLTDETVFTTNEVLVSNSGTLVTLSANTTGLASVFTINEGVRFAKQHFIHHDRQSVVIDRYGTSPTCHVGFTISEDIINAAQDSSLLDPALESSNFSAPGADRFKLTPILTRTDIDDSTENPVSSADYVNLFTIRDGIVQELSERPVYNIIADEIAKRTSDESGDYYVRGLNIQILENLKLANNGGFLTAAEGGSASNLTVMIEPGLAYVKGYEVETLASKYLTIPKATTFQNVNSQIISSRIGDYLTVNEFVGSWNLNYGEKIFLYDTAQYRVSQAKGSSAAQTGKRIGSARVKSISYDSGSYGTASANLRLHIFDVDMLGTNSFANVRSVIYDTPDTSANGGADVVLTTGEAKLKDAQTPLLYYVGRNAIKTIRSPDGTIDTAFTFRRTTPVSISSLGQFSITSSIANEIFPYGSGVLSDADKVDLILSFNEAFSNTLTGTAISSSTNSLTGSALTQFTRLNVGDKISFSGNTKTYIISSIASDTSLTTTENLPYVNGNTISKVYQSGDLVDLRGVGLATGAERTVVTNSNQIVVDLQEFLGSSRSATLTYTMSRTNAREVAKILRAKRYIYINCATLGTSGPYNLGIADVFRITKIIRKVGSLPTSLTDGEDVTRFWTFDSGQRDSHYEHGTIKPTGVTLGATDYLLIEISYFVPDFTLGTGYFSVDSYPVNDQSPTDSQITTAEIPQYLSESGIRYDLRSVLDFRPVYQNVIEGSLFVAAPTQVPATVNPSITYESNGLRLPAESEQITFDYAYYIPRIDVIAIGINGQFKVISGTPSSTPITPQCPDTLMACARIVISPYPSLSIENGRQLNRTDLACFVSRSSNIRYTMKDIGVLKNRVDNLERYVSLSLLEKAALELKVLDENGLDRFKNGIFVDSFADSSLAAFFDTENRICFDPVEKSIRPLFEMQGLGYNYDPGNSTNVVRKGDYVMLPYEETTLIVQPYATTERNVETTVYRFVGKLYLTPDKDFWINVNRLSDLVINVDNTAGYTPYSISYGSWQIISGGQWQRVSYDWQNWGNWNTMSSALTSLGRDAEIYYYYDNIYETNPSSWVGAGAGYLGTGYNYVPDLNSVLGKATKTSLGTYASKPGIMFGGGISPSDLFAIVTRSRSVTETFQEIVTEYTSQGDRVVNVTPIADIRPQQIAFECIGLKASTKHFVFFDGQRMDTLVTPANGKVTFTGSGTIPVSGSEYSDPPANRQFDFTPAGPEGTTLYTDKFGRAYGIIRIPSDGSKTFRTGTKEVILTDSPTNEDDATSSAVAYFTAQGLQQTKQETIIATKKVVSKTRTFTETSKTVLILDRVSCMAYSFIPQCPEGEDGVFLTSFEVFFSRKDPDLGVWFEIREMDNAGNITRTQIPGSEVWLTSEQVLTSDDAKTPTVVTFITPVFLESNKEYALVIHTQGINPNYYMWVAVLGQNDVVNGRPFNSRALTGNLYTTNNNLDWDIVERTDLKCRFLRAKFNTAVIGNAILGNEPFELIKANTVSAPFTNYGESIRGNDRLVLSAPSVTPVVGSRIIGANSKINSAVVSITSGKYQMANTGYQDGEAVTLANANGMSMGTATISYMNTSTAIVYDYRDNINGVNLDLRWSNGSFLQGESLTGQISRESVVVERINDFVYSTLQFEPSYLTFEKTALAFAIRSIANTGTIGSYKAIIPNKIIDLDEEQINYSRSREISTLIGDTSSKIKATMSTASEYLSPVIDVSRSYSIYVHNIVNSNTTNILSPRGSGLKNQYLSQIVTLAEGQDAEDLRVMLTAYRPPTSNSDILVYCRFSNNEDFEPVYAKNWIQMDYFDDGVYSSLANRNDFKEYSFSLPASVMTGKNDQDLPVVEYTNRAGIKFSGFKQFQIKIGLQSDNSAIVPRVSDLRAMALQK